MEKNNVEDNNAQRIVQLEQKAAQLEAALQAAEEVNKAKSS